MTVCFEFPIHLVSGMNVRESSFARAKRVKKERKILWAEWAHQVKGAPAFDYQPIIIRLTRIAPRRFDSDNLASAFKAIRDQIAEQLKINDGDLRVTWLYEQEAGKVQKVRVEIYRNPSAKNWKDGKGRA